MACEQRRKAEAMLRRMFAASPEASAVDSSRTSPSRRVLSSARDGPELETAREIRPKPTMPAAPTTYQVVNRPSPKVAPILR